ncbi:serine hydrolase domain-containing protein [Flavobacterium terrisoli]|uniref:serine hydrolase domain-containing protein n=1 Tax=Flavobacterium terrisoli TaxID=3242195 RepID=UPI0025428004|nr:serine hydrolase domain-containing protein [Flavobacterium buctense]
MTKNTALSFLFLLFITSSFAQQLDTVKLDSLFSILETKDKFMGSVAVSENGKIIYSKAIGKANVLTKQSATITTKYRIGSISKMFTACLIFKAIEEKKLTLDKAIDAYFPSVPNANKITIGNLLNHRSGIYNITNSGEYMSYYTKPKTEAEMVAIIAKNKSVFEPNSKAEYSNSNYILLSYILEKVYKKPFATILTEKIVTPLGLKNTYVGSRTNLQNNESYSYSFQETWTQEKETDMSIPMGAGAVVSNPTDLTVFIEGLFSGKIITAKSLGQMKNIQDNYGMGIFEIPFYDKKGFGHTGGIDGFSSMLSYFPDSKLAVAITSNGNIYPNNDIMIAVLSAYYQIPFVVPTFKVLELSAAELDKYVGSYASQELMMTIKVSRDGNKLSAQATGQGAFPLEATGKDTFEFAQAGIKLVFNVFDKQMTLKQGGGKFIFLKQ